MTPAETPSHDTATDDYRHLIITAYAQAMDINPDLISEPLAQRIESALIAHAADNATAAHQAGISQDQLTHDTTTVSATDGLPLVITADAGAAGKLYFTRPATGWPRPGHRATCA